MLACKLSAIQNLAVDTVLTPHIAEQRGHWQSGEARKMLILHDRLLRYGVQPIVLSSVPVVVAQNKHEQTLEGMLLLSQSVFQPLRCKLNRLF